MMDYWFELFKMTIAVALGITLTRFFTQISKLLLFTIIFIIVP